MRPPPQRGHERGQAARRAGVVRAAREGALVHEGDGREAEEEAHGRGPRGERRREPVGREREEGQRRPEQTLAAVVRVPRPAPEARDARRRLPGRAVPPERLVRGRLERERRDDADERDRVEPVQRRRVRAGQDAARRR